MEAITKEDSEPYFVGGLVRPRDEKKSRKLLHYIELQEGKDGRG